MSDIIKKATEENAEIRNKLYNEFVGDGKGTLPKFTLESFDKHDAYVEKRIETNDQHFIEFYKVLEEERQRDDEEEVKLKKELKKL